MPKYPRVRCGQMTQSFPDETKQKISKRLTGIKE